jgi:SAM-dependent methyltransferase
MSVELKLADYIEWDVPNWAQALDFWRAHTAHDLSRASVLEIGCGSGGLSLWFAQQGARVTCSDIHGPQEKARRKHAASGVEGLIRYEAVDATNIPYRDEFDLVVFKSMLGGIPTKEAQAVAIREMHKALKPGGELLFAENLTASPLHRFLRHRYVKWGREWRYVTMAEMLEFLAPFSRVKTRTLGFAGTFGRSEKQRNALGLCDRVLFNRLVPRRWRYILLGVAGK